MEITATAAAVAPGGSRPSAWHDHLVFEQVFRDRGGQTATDTHKRDERRQVVHAPDELRTVVARDHSLLAEAAALVSERYLWRGYEPPGEASDRHASETLVALQGGRIHGTLTLGFDGPTGLRTDHTFGDRLLAARSQGQRLVELTRLAVAPDADGRRVLSALFALAYRRGRVAHGATDLVVEVNPRHVATYCRLFGFVVASDARDCGRVRAPAVLLWLELRAFDGRLRHPDPREASGAGYGVSDRAGPMSSVGSRTAVTA
jgi:hypothetical protein